MTAGDLNKKVSTLEKIKRIWTHMGIERKKQTFLLAGCILLGAIFEVGSLGAFAPFISILIFPSEQGFRIPILLFQVDRLEITLLFIFLTILTGIFKLVILRKGTSLAFGLGADLSLEIFERAIGQPYKFHLESNSSAIISVGAKVNTVVLGILVPFINLTSSLVMVSAISLTLIVINPLIFLVTGIFLGLAYAIVMIAVRRRLSVNSEVLSRKQTQLIKTQQEALGSIRDILLDHSQKFFSDRYRDLDLPYRDALGSNTFISQFPKYILETVALVLIAGLSYIISEKNQTIVPILGVIALGAQRLLPALQQIYSSWTLIIGNQSSLDDVLAYLLLPTLKMANYGERIELKESIKVKGLCYSYVENKAVFENINFEIFKGQKLGIIGPTGSGKSTFVDLIMGLIPPSKGLILVDEIDIGKKENASKWHRQVAHVPQSIYLADISVMENIAIGETLCEIDIDRVKWAAKIACADEFIDNLERKYLSRVGERGMQLSGGQRQRIGIARAIYKNPSLLVLDEATNALDQATEAKVLKNIANLKITLIVIAHSKEAVAGCDRVISVECGHIK